MSIKFFVLKIRSSEHTTFRTETAAWEVPILEAVHADANDGDTGEQASSNVEVVGEFLVDREPPAAADEFRRLANKYRSPEGTGISYVASVYGNHGVGVQGISRAIKEATVDGEASSPPDAVDPVKVDLSAAETAQLVPAAPKGKTKGAKAKGAAKPETADAAKADDLL